jgi:hypothetical protein
MAVHRDNAGGIRDLIALARRLGARSVKFNLVRDMGRADQMRRMGRTLDVRELIRLGRLVDEEWGPAHGIETSWSWPPAFQPIRKLLRPSLGTCGIHGILGVLASGHYALCGIGRAEEELVYGTLEDDVAGCGTATRPCGGCGRSCPSASRASAGAACSSAPARPTASPPTTTPAAP